MGTFLYRRMQQQLGVDYTRSVFRLANGVVGKIMRADWSKDSRSRIRYDEPDLLDDVVGLIVAHDDGDLSKAANLAGREKTAELYPAYSRHPSHRGVSPLDVGTAPLGRWGKVYRVDTQADTDDGQEGRRQDRMPLGFSFVYPEHDLSMGGASDGPDDLMREALAGVYASATELVRRRVDMFAAGLPASKVAELDGCSPRSARDVRKRFIRRVRNAYDRLKDRC